jgi:hypothetical protein
MNNEQKIDYLAAQIADIIQAITGCPNRAANDLRLILAEFAEEIKKTVY